MRLPLARREGLLVREMADETLVYDLRSHKAHCLNRPAALVWSWCDGKASVGGMAARLGKELHGPADNEIVWLALRELRKAGLLAEGPSRPRGSTRREALRRLGWGVAAPAVVSILAPTAAEAVTCIRSAACSDTAICDQSAGSNCCNKRPCCENLAQTCIPSGVRGRACGCA